MNKDYWPTEFYGICSKNKFSEVFFFKSWQLLQIICQVLILQKIEEYILWDFSDHNDCTFLGTLQLCTQAQLLSRLPSSPKKKRISRIFFLTFLQQMQNRAPCIFSAVMLLKRQLKYCLVALQVNMKSNHKGCFVTMNLWLTNCCFAERDGWTAIF